MRKIIYPLSIVWGILSCYNSSVKEPNSSSDQVTFPEMKINNEDGSADITLHIDHIETLSPEIIKYTVLSKYQGKPVGFTLIYKKIVDSLQPSPEDIVLLPLGDTSNNFLRALSEVYGISTKETVFADSVSAVCASLSSLYGKSGYMIAAQYKLFFGDGSIELYMNIDEKEKTISFPEKDSEYRKDIIEVFSKHKNKE